MGQKHTQSLRVPLDTGYLPGCWYVLRYSRYTTSQLQDKRSGDLKRGVMTDPRDKTFKKEKRYIIDMSLKIDPTGSGGDKKKNKNKFLTLAV